MRILVLVTDAFGGDGGIARFNRDLLGALVDMPEVERIDVLCRHAPRREEATPVKVLRLTAGGGRAVFAARSLCRALLGPRYDVVLCSHLHLAPVAVVAAALARAPLWMHLHGIEAWEAPGALRRAAMRRANLVTAISRYTRARFLAWAGLEPHDVRVLPPAVNERFAPGPRPQALAERLRLSQRRVLLTVARIERGDRYKGHDTVMAALARLAARVPDLDYLIVGDGADQPRLAALAHQLGLGDRVHFAGGVSDSELPDYYRLADVFVMPSAKEGFGIVFLEAAAAGLPVIGGNQDGSADALADGAIGAAVPPGDGAALATAIEAALQARRPDPFRVRRFAANAFQRHVRALLGRVLASSGECRT